MFGYRPVNRRLLKAASSQAMQGSWLRSFLITLISSFIPMLVLGTLPLRMPLEEEIIAAGGDMMKLFSLFLPETITSRTIASFVVTGIIYLLINCPFTVGVHRFYLAVASGERGKFSHVFSPFTSLGTVFSSIGLSLITALWSLFWMIALLAPPLLLMYLGSLIGSSFVVSLCFILYIIVMVVWILKISVCKFAFFIFSEGKTGGAWKSFRMMQKITQARTSELMGLRASYFGWDIAAGCFSGLLFVYNALFSTVYAKYLFCLRNEGLDYEPGFEPEFESDNNAGM